MTRVVIVGAGFGGLAVARALRNTPTDVTVVDRHNYHAFLPLLYQVATSGLTSQDVAHPVRSILRHWPNVQFRLGEVCGADLDARWIALQDGARLPFDFLVLAAGSTTETWGNESVAAHALPLHDLEHALAVRNRALFCLERADATADPALREELLGFVVVGGGPTGVELAGALAELKRHVVPHDFPRLRGDMRVWLLEGQGALLAAFPPRLQAKALLQVAGLGVEVRLQAMVERVDAAGVVLRSGERILARTVVWAAGVRAERKGRSRRHTRGTRTPRGVCDRRPGADQGRRVPPPGRSRRHPARSSGGAESFAGAARASALPFPLPGQGLDGHDRSQPRRGCAVRPRTLGPDCLVGLAPGPSRLPGGISQPRVGAAQLGMELLHLRPRFACGGRY